MGAIDGRTHRFLPADLPTEYVTSCRAADTIAVYVLDDSMRPPKYRFKEYRSHRSLE